MQLVLIFVMDLVEELIKMMENQRIEFAFDFWSFLLISLQN